MSRVVMISGKGGVGKTTVAAATALRAAQLGHASLVASLDRAHNLGDVLGRKLGAEPTRIAPKLWALEADPQVELRRHWRALSGYFGRLFSWAGIGGAQADEIAVFPGLEELLVLSRLTELVESARYELVVVDLAPTASSLRLLGFPELMAGPLGRLVKIERSFLRVTRPALKRILSMPIPDEPIYQALEAIAARLTRLRKLLLDPTSTVVRLVSIPERVVIDETRSAFTLLSLFGLTVDAVVLNRVLPRELGRGYLAGWTRIQAREIERAEEQFAATPLLRLRFQPDEVIGDAALARVARELYGARDPSLPFVDAPPVRFSSDGGETVLEMKLPHAVGRSLDLKQRDDELILTVGGWRRRLPLPESLRGAVVRSAHFSEGALVVRFKTEEAS
jgi:arsenite-transporting ATPase